MREGLIEGEGKDDDDDKEGDVRAGEEGGADSIDWGDGVVHVVTSTTFPKYLLTYVNS